MRIILSVVSLWTLFCAVSAVEFYYQVNSGTCAGSGYVSISDCTQCSAAAAELSITVVGACEATDPGDWPGLNHPTGCASRTSTDSLAILDGKGTFHCSAAYKCLCADPNECTLGTDNCDVNAACTNTAGGFTCECNNGYTGDGTSCVADSCADCACIKNKIVSSGDYSNCPNV